jgi:uncharacterized protein involved in type VI secretion and phage assembly
MYVGVVETVALDAHGCLKVRIPVLNGIFDCRVAMPMAGAGRGMAFLPEKADQVLVAGVMGSDVEFVMLGGLWSANAQPPELAGAQTNDTKVIRTRGGNEIRLIDAEGEERIEIRAQRITLQGDVTVIGSLEVTIEGSGARTKITGNTIDGKG